MKLLNKIIHYIKAKREEKMLRFKLKKMLVISSGLIMGFVVSLILHNIFYAVFGFEDFIFFFLAISIGIFLPFYICYFLLFASYYLVKEYMIKSKHEKN